MAFSTTGQFPSFKTQPKGFVPGYGIVIRLQTELPQRYNADVLGSPSEKGLPLQGTVIAVVGASNPVHVPGDSIEVVVRPNERRQDVFTDLLKANEGLLFLLEGVSESDGVLEARWAHGAGGNRSILGFEIVGPPHVAFENPYPEDGPRTGWLRLNLDGSPTTFDLRCTNGTYTHHELEFDDVVHRLRQVLHRNLRFRVSQRVLAPSKSVLVNNQTELESTLTAFRNSGYTSSVVRTFLAGTTDAKDIDVQILTWPLDVPANGDRVAVVHEMPTLQETPRFVALREAAALAHIEIIPGYVQSLVGNADSSKSTKHTFVRNIVKGVSDGQKNMYSTQNYGPGIGVCALSEDGNVSGLARLALRTEGVQYRNLFSIPTRHFAEAYRVRSEPRKETLSATSA